jgi:hypothetical protein
MFNCYLPFLRFFFVASIYQIFMKSFETIFWILNKIFCCCENFYNWFSCIRLYEVLGNFKVIFGEVDGNDKWKTDHVTQRLMECVLIGSLELLYGLINIHLIKWSCHYLSRYSNYPIQLRNLQSGDLFIFWANIASKKLSTVH